MPTSTGYVRAQHCCAPSPHVRIRMTAPVRTPIPNHMDQNGLRAHPVPTVKLNAVKSHPCAKIITKLRRITSLRKKYRGGGYAPEIQTHECKRTRDSQIARLNLKSIARRNELCAKKPTAQSREPVRATPASIAIEALRVKRATRARQLRAIPQRAHLSTQSKLRSPESRLRALHR
jgi:hypothetical protein